jgi:hypothetical protein
MILRLVLVSMVAGLGVAPPAESEMAAWTQRVQIWLDAGLDAWAISTPPEGSSEAAATEPARAIPGPETFDDELWALTEELPPADENNEGKAAPAGDAADSPDARFQAVVDEIVAQFAREAARRDEVVEVEVDENEAIAALTSPSMATLPAGEAEPFELCDDADLDRVLADEWHAPAETAVVAAPAPAPAPAVEPTSDEALAEQEPAPAPERNPLGHAVRLTRDAVSAWMNVLQSSALVSITH